jgi:hypothetical protein
VNERFTNAVSEGTEDPIKSLKKKTATGQEVRMRHGNRLNGLMNG